MHKTYKILAVNPGSISTKIAVYEDYTCLYEKVIRHSSDILKNYATINDQFEFRKDLIKKALSEHGISITALDAVVGRGGPLKPLLSGTYLVNEKMYEDLKYHVQTEHASKLGGLIAKEIADEAGIPAYIVDPVSVDEFEPLARITGIPEIRRRSLFHALNLKAAAHRFAADNQKDYFDLVLILVHLGGGISVGIQKNGRMIDVANPNGSGPFSPERAGSLPTADLVKLCFSGKYTQPEIEKKLIGEGGLVAHLGTNDARIIEQRIAEGDLHAALVYEAMAYQVAKEIGALCTVAEGKIDAIILTGGLAHSTLFTTWLKRRVAFIAKVYVYPGEDELRALTEGVMRILKKEEEVQIYE